MASLLILSPKEPPRSVPLFRAATTLGRDPACDVPLAGAGLCDLHAEIVQEGSLFQIRRMDGDADVVVNGRKVKNAYLEPWDVIRLGDRTLLFAPGDEMPWDAGAGESAHTHLESLADFSRRLMEARDLDKALNTLLDEALHLTRAEKGFILLVEDDRPSVRAARNIDRKTLPDDEVLFSESVLQKALRDGEPQLVVDALNRPEFSTCTSIINLRLSSVACIPLKIAGETRGVLYLGTDRLVNLLDPAHLRTLQIFAAQAAMILQNLALIAALEQDNRQLKQEVQASRFGSLVGSCPGMMEVFERIRRLAPSDVPVLILGETGTGKELVARELHGRSPRSGGPFVAVNCGAIPENLIESELFGHVRGAFTGAVAASIGKFQAAHRGTLFLDEIGELPLALQVKLLRVLQDGLVTRVGGTRPEKVDVRVLAATNRDLREEVRRGRFREDLYYRVAVVSLTLPPLRERGGDIEVLARFFLHRFATESGAVARSFSPEALKAMRGYPWPGNIRELENRVRKAVLFATGPVVTLEDLELPKADDRPVVPLAEARERFERDYVQEVLRRNQGNRTKTARDLGVEPRTIFRYLERERASGKDL